MKKLIKWVFISGGLLTLLLVATVLLFPIFVDVQSWKPVIEKKVSEAAGRPFSLGGDLDLSFFPLGGSRTVGCLPWQSRWF